MSTSGFVQSGSATLTISRFGTGTPTIVLLHPVVADALLATLRDVLAHMTT